MQFLFLGLYFLRGIIESPSCRPEKELHWTMAFHVIRPTTYMMKIRDGSTMRVATCSRTILCDKTVCILCFGRFRRTYYFEDCLSSFSARSIWYSILNRWSIYVKWLSYMRCSFEKGHRYDFASRGALETDKKTYSNGSSEHKLYILALTTTKTIMMMNLTCVNSITILKGTTLSRFLRMQ